MNEFLALQVIDEVERMFPLETGGILMGNIVADDVVNITAIVGPGPTARHSRTSFVPDYQYQIEEVAKLYHSSEGINTYLGDWHSHPDGNRFLSHQDRMALQSIACSNKARCSSPLMMIISGKARFHIQVWQWRTGCSEREVAVQVEIIKNEEPSLRSLDGA